MSFKVERCTDFDYIKSIMVDDDEMWERISDDYSVRDADILPKIGAIWLKCYDDNGPAGAAYIKYSGHSTIEGHILIPKESRGKGTRQAGISFLRWIKANVSPRFCKINTKVPVIYKDVIRYAKSLGFQDEGLDRKSIMKNGQLLDRQMLGITFEEIR